MDGIVLTKEQKAAHDELIDGYKARKKVQTLGGYAGTGKTTLVSSLVETLREERLEIAFCAFTGKAANVLMGKLEKAGMLATGDYCGTIHGLIYNPRISGGRVVGFDLKNPEELSHIDLFIVDEASMVTEDIFNDLSSYGKPIIAIGDHGQLPPVGREFDLMKEPQVKLETIMRQAKNNPIITVATLARETGKIPFQSWGDSIIKTSKKSIISDRKWSEDDLYLCAKNATRVGINKYIRELRGLNSESIPHMGEPLICLKNNRDAMIFNGMVGKLLSISAFGNYWFNVEIGMENQIYEGRILKLQFNRQKTIQELDELSWDMLGDLFDFAYCMTVHKSQGSESKAVILTEERMSMQSDESWRRWLYTGVTRAKEELVIYKEES